MLLSGSLTHVLPEWTLSRSNLHAVFPSRRGLVPAVRCFIDFLAQRMPQVVGEYGVRDFVAPPESL